MQFPFANRFAPFQEPDGADSYRVPDRRRVLKLGATSLLMPFLLGRLLRAQTCTQPCAPPIPVDRPPSNGGWCPYPIPWLDKNGNHNQPAGPNVELSNIYHFKGKLARCSGEMAWAPIIRAIAWRGALLRPTTA